MCTRALLLVLLSLGTPSSALLLSAPRSMRVPWPPPLSTPRVLVVCSAHSRRKKRAKLPSKDALTAVSSASYAMQGGVGLQLSTAADGLPLPTCVVAFDQEPAVQPVRLVIISDTHGFEQSMTNHSAMALQSMANSRPAADAVDAADAADADADAPAAVAAAADDPAASRAAGALPEGDVLIHCGDFTPGPIFPNGERVQPAEAQACIRASIRDRDTVRRAPNRICNPTRGLHW